MAGLLEEDSEFEKISPSDLQLGEKLNCDLYDGDRKLLKKKGEAVMIAAEIDGLFAKGVYKLEDIKIYRETSSPLVEKDPSKPGAVFRRAGSLAAPKKPEEPQAPVKPKSIPFLEAKPHIGTPIQLQSGPQDPKFVVRLIGFLEDKGLIVSTPKLDNEFALVREWTTFTARFFTGLHAHEFTTNVIKQTTTPYPMMHLSYPKNVLLQKIRSSHRVETDLIMIAIDPVRGIKLPGKIFDLATNGASMGSIQPLGEVGDRFTASFKINVQGMESLIELTCQIRKVLPPSGKMKFGYGVSFHDIEASLQFALSAYVNHTKLSMH